jgi:arylsulfatase A-like enzyme
MDRAMGNLRAGLEGRDLDANTLIWYTSDNGSHKPADHIRGLRGHKGEMWGGGIRVPATIVWPKGITEPIETEMVASTSDIMPTMLDLLDITPENHKFDGISLASLIRGAPKVERSKPMPFWRVGKFAREARNSGSDFTEEQLHGWWRDFSCPRFTTARTEGFDGWAAWTEGRWKLHKRGNDQYELYDLLDDPAETTDLASRMPEKVEELAGRLLEWQRSAEKSLAGADLAAEPVSNDR